MTNKEAIKVLNQEIDTIYYCMPSYDALHDKNIVDRIEAHKLAIKVLRQEPCDDCISRQAVLDKINEVCFSKEKKWIDFRASWGSNGQRDLIIEFIESLPSVTPQLKISHWIDTGSGQECSECGEIQYGHDSFRYFCANCGARMEG